MKALLALLLAACGRGEPPWRCDADLTGVYDVGDARWMILDEGRVLSGFPLVPDGGAGRAPRALALTRGEGGALTGAMRRRYTQRAVDCEASAPVRVTACAGGALELVLADPTPPLGFAPCAWSRPESSRVERWRRE